MKPKPKPKALLFSYMLTFWFGALASATLWLPISILLKLIAVCVWILCSVLTVYWDYRRAQKMQKEESEEWESAIAI